ncbi:uncharacterized protein TRAVEDRAFT_95499, partial [Trametes versicolor FP-101664 SS1]|uniref:uncharacterized protein n=1 Tax=Trametes versicolor (strain FP-101664) TaxID=717944 RepID=UPI0004623722
MGATLVSISRATAAGASATFHKGGCRISNLAGEVVVDIPMIDRLYRITNASKDFAVPAAEKVPPAKGECVVSIDELHQMMGHVSYKVARAVVTKGLAKGIVLDLTPAPAVCNACESAKMTRKAIARKHVRPRAENIGDELHSDLWGPAPVQTLGARHYNSMFMDDCS